MSTEQETNVELARRAFEAFNAGDADGVLALLDPEVEIYMPNELPNSGTFHGHAGYHRWTTNWLDAWEDVTFELQDVRDAGDRVAVWVRARVRGRASGVMGDLDWFACWRFSGAKVIGYREYATWDEVLTDVSLVE